MTPEELKRRYAKLPSGTVYGLAALKSRTRKTRKVGAKPPSEKPVSAQPWLTDSAKTVPFGKYRSQSLETLLDDDNYIQWICDQPGMLADLQRRYPLFSAALLTAMRKPLSPEEQIAKLAKKVDGCYQAGERADFTHFDAVDMKDFGVCMDLLRKIRSILETLGIDPTEDEERAAIERVSRLQKAFSPVDTYTNPGNIVSQAELEKAGLVVAEEPHNPRQCSPAKFSQYDRRLFGIGLIIKRATVARG